MKKIIIILFVVFIAGKSFAAAPSSAADLAAYELSAEKTHFTFGVGVATDLIGGIVKNGMGEPKNGFSINTLLGFSFTTYFGSNSVDDIFNFTKQASSELSASADIGVIKEYVKSSKKKSSFSYFRAGTAILIYPIIWQVGYCWLPSDHTRFELGAGLPLVLSFGFNLDF